MIVSKQLQLFHNYTIKIWLACVSESRNLPYCESRNLPNLPYQNQIPKGHFKIEVVPEHDPHQETFTPHRTTIQRLRHYILLPWIDRKNSALFVVSQCENRLKIVQRHWQETL